MARSFGKLLPALAVDLDFNAMLAEEQVLYLRLLGSPGMSLVGVVEYRPAKWQTWCGSWPDATAVEVVVSALVEQRYLLVDLDTRELLVRTFMRHDGVPVGNPRMRRAVWNQWHEVASGPLRAAIVEHMPVAFFDHDDVPEVVRQLTRLEPNRAGAQMGSAATSADRPGPQLERNRAGGPAGENRIGPLATSNGQRASCDQHLRAEDRDGAPGLTEEPF